MDLSLTAQNLLDFRTQTSVPKPKAPRWRLLLGGLMMDYPPALVAELSRIAEMGAEDLRCEWSRTAKGAPPEGLSKTLMRNALAYKAQAAAFGDLAAGARRKLTRLADRLARDPKANVLAGETLSPGARLVREWGGRRHEVKVGADGFIYCGKPYRSLTEVAEVITGSHRSGPRFFNVKTKRRP